MKTIKITSALLFLLLTIIGCNSEANFATKTVDNKFELSVPDYMKDLALGNVDANLQMGHALKEHYAMVIHETKASLVEAGLNYSVEDYAKFALDFLKSGMVNPKVQRVSDDVVKINDLESVSYKVWGAFENDDIGEIVKVFYYITIYKSETDYYAFSTWTLQDREKKYLKIMEQMINSFKEV